MEEGKAGKAGGVRGRPRAREVVVATRGGVALLLLLAHSRRKA